MLLRRILLSGLWAGLLLGGGGCAALGAATGGVKDATSATKDVSSTTQGAQDAAKGAGDQAKGAAGALPGGKGGGGKNGDPDGDGSRAAAKEAKVNEPLTDNLDPKKNDSVDWRVFDLQGRAGLATAQLNWDEANADLAVDVYDAFGTQLATSPPKGPSTSKRATVRIEQPGRYYVKVSSLKGASDYTVALRFGEPGFAGSPVRPPPPPPPAVAAAGGSQIPNPAAPGGSPPPAGGAAPPAGAAGAPAAGAAPPADDPLHPRGKIVSSFLEDGKVVLYIDKGSAASVSVGMTGFILEGKEGDNRLAGGDFKIVKVIDATRSVAHTTAKVGKNNRCVINLVK